MTTRGLCYSARGSRAPVDKGLALIDAQVFDAAMLDMNLNGNDSQLVAVALCARGVPFVYSNSAFKPGPLAISLKWGGQNTGMAFIQTVLLRSKPI